MHARRERSHFSGVSNRCQARTTRSVRDISNLRLSAQREILPRDNQESPLNNLRSRQTSRLPNLAIRKSADNAYGLQLDREQLRTRHRRTPSGNLESNSIHEDKYQAGTRSKMSRYASPTHLERRLDSRSYSFVDKKTAQSRNGAELSPSQDSVETSADRYTLKKSQSYLRSSRASSNHEDNRLVQIRSFMRHRYEKRNKLTKVFLDWDQRCKGRINADDVKTMIEKMGMKISPDEAKTIVTAADQGGNQELNHNDFFKLITGSEDNIDLYLRTIGHSKSDSRSMSGLRGPRSPGSSVATEVKSQIMQKSLDEVADMKRTIIKNQVRTATTQLEPKFLQADKNLSGKVDYSQFKNVMAMLKLPSSIADEKSLKSVYDEYVSRDTGEINYKSFLRNMKNYDCHLNDDLKIPNPQLKARFGKFYESHRTSMDSMDSPDRSILDHNKVTQNRLEAIEKQVQRVSRIFKNVFKDKGNLEKAMKNYASGEQQGKPQIGMTHLHDFCNDVLGSKKVDAKTTKDEVDGFLSAFSYDKHRNAQVDSIAEMIFSDGLQQHLRLNDNRRTRFKPQFTANNIGEEARVSTRATTRSMSVLGHSTRAKEIIQELEEKVYDGHKQRQYDIYRSFDVDNDGFVSRKDLKNRIRRLNINASHDELSTVCDILDPDRNGYMDFKEFSKHIRPNQGQEDTKGNRLVRSSIEPSSELLEHHLSKVTEYGAKEKRMRRQIAANNEHERVSDFVNANRFKHSPPIKDTFVNLYPAQDTSSYLDERSRFDRGGQLDFQKADAQRRRQIHTSRVNRIRENRSRIDKTIQQHDQSVADKDFYKLNKKSTALFLYDSSVPLNTE